MSCVMMTQESDDEVDLEALRLAALKSRKPKYPRVNHNNLIPIVPVNVETPDFEKTKIKIEKVSPTPEDNVEGKIKIKNEIKENEEKESHCSESTMENDQDILSMDDKEEEDSLEKLIDQLEAEISGKAPIPTDKLLSSKNYSNKKSNKDKSNSSKLNDDDEIELVQIKSAKEPGAIIEIRESTSPEPVPKENIGKAVSPELLKSPRKRLRSRSRSRSRTPFSRTRSPYRWSRSPRRSRSPFRRSRSPFWLSRRSRSLSRRSRSPFGRYRSPGRKRSPLPRFSRSRSRSFVRRRSSWSLSPRRRSKSPILKDGLPPRRRNFNSPLSRGKRSFSPRDGSRSPRRRSRSPRRFSRNSPNRWSKSPFRRSRSPLRRTKSPMGWSQSRHSNRSKSPISRTKSPASNKSPLRKSLPRRSKSPSRRSLPKSSDRASSKPHSRSPTKRYNFSPRSRRRGSNDGKSFSTSPGSRRNRSPLRAVEKNKMNDKSDSHRIRNRNEKMHRSLSRENNKTYDRRHRQRNYKRFSPSRNRKTPERLAKRSSSPKGKETVDKSKEGSDQAEKEKPVTPAAPADPVLEARRKKFETLGEVDPTVDKKISLKAIKESTENVEDDEDALTINVESNLWDESEESENDFESRFKSEDARKNRTVEANQNILSFRSLREGDGKKINFNKPLTDDNRRGRYAKSERYDRWQQGRRNDRNDRKKRRNHDGSRSKHEVNDFDKNNSNSQNANSRRPDWKPIVWSEKDKGKPSAVSKSVSATQSEVKSDQNKNSEKKSNEERDKTGKDKTDSHETDDFEKLISDFEKELEVDTSIFLQDANITLSANQNEETNSKISIKKDAPEPKVESLVKRSSQRVIRINEPLSNREKKDTTSKNTIRLSEENERLKISEPQQSVDGPEDYIEDDDFVLEVSARRKQRNKEEEDSQSDLRAVLSRRRNERLTKVVPTQENMPTRLVQSAFQGLVSIKSKRQIQEVQETEEFSSFEKPVKSSASEGRRVLLLQRNKNPSIQSVKCTVPQVKPNTIIYQRFTRLTERKKRKLHRPSDPIEDMQQEEEEEGFEAEEGKQSRRFRLKRNIKLSSQFEI